MMGRSSSTFLISLPNVNPSFLGIIISKMHKSKEPFLNLAQPSSPSLHKVVLYPFMVRYSWRISPRLGSSSTTKSFALFMFFGDMNDKIASFFYFTFDIDFAMMRLYHGFYIRQSQSESFDVMDISCGYPIEFIKDFFLGFLGHAYSIVFDRNDDLIFSILSVNGDPGSFPRVFIGIVK